MEDAVICNPVRTAVGRYGGVLRSVPVEVLAATVVRGVIDRSGVDPTSIDDVIMGQGYANGEAPCLGRVAALDAGLPVSVPGAQIDRRCGSGLNAVILAAMQVQTGASDIVIAGGAESMSQTEFYATGLRWNPLGASITFHDRLARGRTTAGGRYHPVEGGMIETAENLRREFSIPRAEQDEFALESHMRAVRAQRAGTFAEEILPMEVETRDGMVVVDEDEHPRANSSMEKLAALRPIREAVDPEATVTAGNASGQNDGGAACIVASRSAAERLGLEPMARLVAWGAAGVEPERMGIGPVPATATALGRAGLAMGDIDLFEVNEAFAAQVLAVARWWNFGPSDFDRLNVNGSGISLGHPIGATGGRILATLLHEMRRREARYGLETMCIGGGQGIAAIFESLR